VFDGVNFRRPEEIDVLRCASSSGLVDGGDLDRQFKSIRMNLMPVPGGAGRRALDGIAGCC
jgi:hypothetical protein